MGTRNFPPSNAFSDEEASPRHFERLGEPDAGTARHAAAVVRRRIMSSSAGWKQRPTTGEFYDAVRAEHPARRQRAIVDMWGGEAIFYDFIEAWAPRAYIDRQLVRTLHLT